MQLTESDLRFVLETVVTSRRDHERILELVRDKQDLVEPLLDDPRLVERLLNTAESFAQVSPYLMFQVLLRCVQRDLTRQSYVIDRDTAGRRIPVFEAQHALALVTDPTMREYLAQMLCSFVRTHTSVVYFKERGHWRKRKFSDLDLRVTARLVDGPVDQNQFGVVFRYWSSRSSGRGSTSELLISPCS